MEKLTLILPSWMLSLIWLDKLKFLTEMSLVIFSEVNDEFLLVYKEFRSKGL